MPILNMVWWWKKWGNIWEPLNLTTTLSAWLDVTITWEDNEIWTIPPTTFQKSELVRKIGSAPTSPSDWDLVVTETVKDTYKVSWYVDQWLTVWETYYYRVFSYSDLGGISYCDAVSQKVERDRPDIDSFSQTLSTYSWTSSSHAVWASGDWDYIYIGRAQTTMTAHYVTDWDLTNFSTTATSSLWGYQSRWLRCKPDWTKLFDSHDSKDIYVISMWTPYSLTWATVSTFSESYPCCWISLSYDGTKLYYWIWDYDRQFMEYDLSTPRDVSTRTNGTIHQATEVTTWWDWPAIYQTQISPTGKKILLCGTDWKIHQYNLGTAYDWSTAVYYGYLDTGFSARCSFQFTEDWQRFYALNLSNHNLYQYDAS